MERTEREELMVLDTRVQQFNDADQLNPDALVIQLAPLQRCHFHL